MRRIIRVKREALSVAATRPETTTMSNTPKRALAPVLAGAIAISTVLPAAAGPIPTAGLGAIAPQQTSDVRWRHHGGAVAGGIFAGLALGAIAAAAARPHYYYDPGYAYYGDAYPPPVVYAPPAYDYGPPAVYAPADPYGPARRCFVRTDDRGYGYWQPC